jgi:DNA-binding transcriptional LysR family regulator
VTSFLAAVRLVAASRLMCVLPEEVVFALGAGVVAHPVPIPVPTLPIELLWHPRMSSDPRHRFLRERVAAAVAARAASFAI